MKGALSRIALFLAAGFLVAAIAPGGAAHADVLEIGAAGPVWVAGGPERRLSLAAAATVDAVSGPADLSGNSKAVVTEADHSAGPAMWRARVGELAAKYDISPALLEAVVWQESRWRTNAVSPVGARGLAQLMPGTARMMGVNPDDPHANLEGGARYLRMQLDAFDGNIEKALAAYNAGPGRVIRAGGIPPIRETQNYVAAILARLTMPVRSQD